MKQTLKQRLRAGHNGQTDSIKIGPALEICYGTRIWPATNQVKASIIRFRQAALHALSHSVMPGCTQARNRTQIVARVAILTEL